jgi:hypothetical protein
MSYAGNMHVPDQTRRLIDLLHDYGGRYEIIWASAGRITAQPRYGAARDLIVAEGAEALRAMLMKIDGMSPPSLPEAALESLRTDFPTHQFAEDTAPGEAPRIVAVARKLRVSPHTVVTGDIAELRAALTAHHV